MLTSTKEKNIIEQNPYILGLELSKKRFESE